VDPIRASAEARAGFAEVKSIADMPHPSIKVKQLRGAMRECALAQGVSKPLHIVGSGRLQKL